MSSVNGRGERRKMTTYNDRNDIVHDVKDQMWDHKCPVCGKPAISRYRNEFKNVMSYKHLNKKPKTERKLGPRSQQRQNFPGLGITYETTYCEKKIETR
jgi:predicted RNA-binding Zn-ribbon protein involved in translation (DUF1610 family)